MPKWRICFEPIPPQNINDKVDFLRLTQERMQAFGATFAGFIAVSHSDKSYGGWEPLWQYVAEHLDSVAINLIRQIPGYNALIYRLDPTTHREVLIDDDVLSAIA